MVGVIYRYGNVMKVKKGYLIFNKCHTRRFGEANESFSISSLYLLYNSDAFWKTLSRVVQKNINIYIYDIYNYTIYNIHFWLLRVHGSFSDLIACHEDQNSLGRITEKKLNYSNEKPFTKLVSTSDDECVLPNAFVVSKRNSRPEFVLVLVLYYDMDFYLDSWRDQTATPHHVMLSTTTTSRSTFLTCWSVEF